MARKSKSQNDAEAAAAGAVLFALLTLWGFYTLTDSIKIAATIAVLVFFAVLIGVLMLIAGSKKKVARRSAKKISARSSISKTNSSQTFNRASKHCRADGEILSSPLNRITGAEFERLLALYFLDNGYEVKEVGVGGSDGGVDLVIKDKRGEKTAVQAKCYADHRMINVDLIRNLGTAKRNHDCILSLLVTTSDLTEPAKKEADKFHIDYWHGAYLEHKLKSWGKWNPNRKKSANSQISEARRQVAASSEKRK